MNHIESALLAYEREITSYHMPGHKFGKMKWMTDVFKLDATEVEGLDHLLNETGILKQAQEDVARLYGVHKTFFLVNGSTVGILAAISTGCHLGTDILVGRNAHQSVYHAIEINRLNATYLYPNWLPEWGIFEAYSPDEVRIKLSENDNIKAVVITSPTYEGIFSDVKTIADIVHEYGKILIVDEAHGAHLRFHTDFEQSAADLGADIVIQSLHKTLPFMTQCALLHVCSERVNDKVITKYLKMFQTSSPSYVFMSQMEKGIKELNEMPQLFQTYVDQVKKLRNDIEKIPNIELLKNVGFGQDIGKIVISATKMGLTGSEVNQFLREECQLQVELVGIHHVLAMTSIADMFDEQGNKTERGFEKLLLALEKLEKYHRKDLQKRCMNFQKQDEYDIIKVEKAKMTLFEAGKCETEKVALSRAVGEICGGAVIPYPPGIPVVLPGEVYSEAIVRYLEKAQVLGIEINGLESGFVERII